MALWTSAMKLVGDMKPMDTLIAENQESTGVCLGDHGVKSIISKFRPGGFAFFNFIEGFLEVGLFWRKGDSLLLIAQGLFLPPKLIK